MFHTRWLPGLAGLTISILAIGGGGCDGTVADSERNPDQAPRPSVTTPGASTQPATQAAARVPVAPQPVDTFMSIAQDGAPPQMVAFPPAKLRLKKSELGTLHAVVYTDDPAAAARSDFKGNSYLFEMDLADVAEPADVGRAQFRYRADGSVAGDREVETTNGVFLNGWETHLQPVDAVVVFEGQAPQLLVKIAGRFRVVNEDPDSAPHVAMIQAVLPVLVEKDKKK